MVLESMESSTSREPGGLRVRGAHRVLGALQDRQSEVLQELEVRRGLEYAVA